MRQNASIEHQYFPVALTSTSVFSCIEFYVGFCHPEMSVTWLRAAIGDAEGGQLYWTCGKIHFVARFATSWWRKMIPHSTVGLRTLGFRTLR
jgi:hypothetical protein